MKDNTEYKRVITITRIGLSAIVLAAALFVILSNDFSADHNKWAFGLVGLVMGYWLR